METYSCDPCKFRGVDSSSVTFCKTCQEQLCKECADVHKSSRATRRHFLVDIKGLNVNSVTGKTLEGLRRCLSHPEKLLEFFCVEHNHLICSICLLLHQSDISTNVFEISKAGEALLQSKFTEKVKADLHSVKLKLEQDKKSIKFQQAATKKAHTDIKDKLCETREKLLSIFHKLENEILLKVQRDEENENKSFAFLLERMSEMLERLDDASSVLQSAIENESGSDVFRCILLICNYLEDCEASLDMKKTMIGTCQHSLKLSTALHLLLNENIRMMLTSERHHQFFFTSEFPSLQVSVSECLKISSRSEVGTDNNNGIINSNVEKTTRNQYVEKHNNDNDYPFEPNVALCEEDKNTRFSQQYAPSIVPTYTPGNHSTEQDMSLNEENMRLDEVQTSPLTKGKTSQTITSQKEKSEETVQVFPEHSFIQPQLKHKTSRKNAYLEDLNISNQNQKNQAKKEADLTRRRAENHCEDMTTSKTVSLPDQRLNASNTETEGLFKDSVLHFDENNTHSANVQNSSSENVPSTRVGASVIQITVCPNEEVDNNEKTFNQKKDANKQVLWVEEINNSACTDCVELETKDSLYVREFVKHTGETGSEKYDKVHNECQEYSRVKKELMYISELTGPVIKKASDCSKPCLNKCCNSAKEPVEEELVRLDEQISPIVRMEKEEEHLEKEQMSPNTETSVSGKMLEYDGHCNGAVATRDDINPPRRQISDIDKEYDKGQGENTNGVKDPLPLQSIHHEDDNAMPIHSDKTKDQEEQVVDTKFDIESESVLKVPWRSKKKFDLFSVLTPSNERVIVCDFCNNQVIILDKQFKVLDTFHLPAKMVNVNLLKGQLIAMCHEHRSRVTLMEYSPSLKTIHVLNVKYLAMCVQSVDDTNVLVSMCDSVGHWHLHIMSNTGQLIRKLKLKRTILDGNCIAVMFSENFRLGYRIVQCCEKSETLYCFETEGTDIFKFEVPSPNCVAVHDSGYIFLIDHFNNLYVLSSSGKQLYKTKCCSDVTSIAITPSMDKVLLTRYKHKTITVLSVVKKLKNEL